MQSFMNRSEAIAVLHEIYDLLKESVTVNHVSLDDKSQLVKNGNGYEIKMQCAFDKDCWDGVEQILERHGLGMRLVDDFVIIYSLSLCKIVRYSLNLTFSYHSTFAVGMHVRHEHVIADKLAIRKHFQQFIGVLNFVDFTVETIAVPA